MMIAKKWDIYELVLMFSSYNDVIWGVLSKEILANKLTEQYNVRLLNYSIESNEYIKDFNSILELLNIIELLNSGGKIPDGYYPFTEKYIEYKENAIKYDKLLKCAIKQSMEGYKLNNRDQLSNDFIMLTANIGEKVTQQENKADNNNLKVVSFEVPQDFTFTKPVKFTYFKREYYVRSWSDLYVSLVKCIQTDYPGEIEKFNGANLNTGWRIDIGDKQFVSQMANPKPINHGFYIMTKLSPEFIVKKIVTIMKRVGIEFADVSIYYRSNTI